MCIEAAEWTGDGAHTTKRIFRRAFERSFSVLLVILRESWGGLRGNRVRGTAIEYETWGLSRDWCFTDPRSVMIPVLCRFDVCDDIYCMYIILFQALWQCWPRCGSLQLSHGPISRRLNWSRSA